MVFANDKLIGDMKSFLKWAEDVHNFEEFRTDSLYETLRKEAYASYILNTKVAPFHCYFYFFSIKNGTNIL